MGNHDLLSDDDFFEKSKPGKKDPKTKKDEVYSEEEDFLKSKPLDQDALDLEDIESSLQERPDGSDQKSYNLFDEDPDERDSFEPAKAESEPIAAPAKPKAQKDVQYQKVYFDADAKQQGISYKPFIIGILVVAVLAVAGYFLYNWYTGSKSTFAQQEVTEASEVPPVSEQTAQAELQTDQRKVNFIGNIAGRTSQELNSVSGVIAAGITDTKLSSVLLYDSDLMFEVFGNNREDLARLSIKLKEKFKNQDFKIVSSSQRPGENGGIFGVYTASLGGSGFAKKELGPAFTSGREADEWLQSIFTQSKLKYNGVKSRKSKSVDMFTVYEIETTASGSIEGCMNAISKIAAAGSNVRIHKLICNAVDQKDFTASKYQLKLVLKIYT